MRLYLDNCCFNRPYDDQSQTRVQLETLAKLHVQDELRSGVHELAWSYVLDFENANNPFPERREAIAAWKNLAAANVSSETAELLDIAEELQRQGVKAMDALHVACASVAGCDRFLTTDRRLLRARTEGVVLQNPVDFVATEDIDEK